MNSILLHTAVNEDILLIKLEYYGIRERSLSVLRFCLKERNQRVKIEICTWNSLTITCGVLQGSALGPFFLYRSSIYLSSLNVTFHFFADDTFIFHSHNISILEAELNVLLHNITYWFRANKLTLNVWKSNFLLFNVGNKHQNKFEISTDQAQLEQKEYAKYLGISIDNPISWKKHIQTTNLKISKGIAIIPKSLT